MRPERLATAEVRSCLSTSVENRSTRSGYAGCSKAPDCGRAAPFQVQLPGLGRRGDESSPRGRRDGPSARGPEQGRSGLCALGSVRAPAYPDGRLVALLDPRSIEGFGALTMKRPVDPAGCVENPVAPDRDAANSRKGFPHLRGRARPAHRLHRHDGDPTSKCYGAALEHSQAVAQPVAPPIYSRDIVSCTSTTGKAVKIRLPGPTSRAMSVNRPVSTAVQRTDPGNSDVSVPRYVAAMNPDVCLLTASGSTTASSTTSSCSNSQRTNSGLDSRLRNYAIRS